MGKLLIKNGTIIDVENGVSFIGAIEVEGNKIKRLIKQDEVLPIGIETIDAKGKYIIPGLIDIASTFINWFNFLSTRNTTSIVNFWTPTPWNVRKLENEVHFLFLLKSTYRKIAGYGI